MVQDRLNYLTIMSTASDLLKIMDFNDIIDDFAAKKSRKVIVSRFMISFAKIKVFCSHS